MISIVSLAFLIFALHAPSSTAFDMSSSEMSVVYRYGELALRDPASYRNEIVISPRPYSYLLADELPASWDWRNVDGLSYTTPIQNQHIPVYCGSCWSFSAMSSLGDRLNIASNGQHPDIMPAPQVLINCGSAGDCNGGDSGAAYAWIYEAGGIPDTSCQAYEAQNRACTAENICRNCNATFSRLRKGQTCFAVTEYPKIYVEEHGNVTGDAQIMAEIFARGPVVCYIDAGPLEGYTGGVNMYEGAGRTNHAIALVGWGETEDGLKYYVGRNSWGTYWGENGWFRIVRGGLFDAGTCFWAVPSSDFSDYRGVEHSEERMGRRTDFGSRDRVSKWSTEK